jgi:hypothetical protein
VGVAFLCQDKRTARGMMGAGWRGKWMLELNAVKWAGRCGIVSGLRRVSGAGGED